jgi:hypothetical protein
MFSHLIAAAVVAASWQPTSTSQLTAMERASLRGFKTTKVVVEKLTFDAQACNITGKDLELAATQPLVDAGIGVEKRADPDVWIYVQASVLIIREGCIASVDVSAHTIANAKLMHTQGPVRVQVRLWSQGRMFTGPASTFGERVKSKVREMVDQFATKVKLANAR